MPQQASAIHKLTWHDWLDFPHGEGGLHELIDGEHVVTPSPLVAHQWFVMVLANRVFDHVQAQGLGTVLAAPLGAVLSEHDVVEPDLLFVSNRRKGIVGDWIRGAPDLVVEVLSPSTRRRDEVVKRLRYERHGVDEYWLLGPAARAVRVLRRRGDRLLEAESLSAAGGDRLRSPLLPGLEIPLADLFAAPPLQTD
ncbi:MAG TPA: Uma2 family endonuclease [Thermoanaerobaculia bacterium]|nr:Uma2 family endonuclease [Thermoanaerobaculia bacterium]